MNVLVTLVADYGGKSGVDDLAFAEVKKTLYDRFYNENINIVGMNTLSVNAFNTIETSFVVSQLALPKRSSPTHLVYCNTAPRKDDTKSREQNDGEKLAIFYSNASKTFVIGPNSGYTFSILKDYGIVYEARCENKGSQFRSRDIYPKFIVDFIKIFNCPYINIDNSDKYVKGIIENIPNLPSNIVLSVDGYGNIKTNIELTEEQLNKKELYIKIGEQTAQVKVSDGIFSVPDGEFVIAEGSSGSYRASNYLEISLRGGSASKHFDYPLPGTSIEINCYR